MSTFWQQAVHGIHQRQTGTSQLVFLHSVLGRMSLSGNL